MVYTSAIRVVSSLKDAGLSPPVLNSSTRGRIFRHSFAAIRPY